MIQTLASNVELHSHFYLTLQQPDPLLSRWRGSRVLHKVSTLAHFLGMIFEAFFCPQETICRNENTCKSRNSKEPERDNMDK